MNPIRVLLVDDQASICRGLQMRLSLEPDIEVAGQACDGELALDLVARLSPDVVVMDIEMPVMDGLEAVRRMRLRSGGPEIVMHSLHDDPATRKAAATAGASRFVSKHQGVDALIDAIRDSVRARPVEGTK